MTRCDSSAMSRARRMWLMAIAVAALIAPGVAAALTVELNLLYVHGIKNCTASRQTAEDSLADLAAVVDAALPDCSFHSSDYDLADRAGAGLEGLRAFPVQRHQGLTPEHGARSEGLGAIPALLRSARRARRRLGAWAAALTLAGFCSNARGCSL
jgi:hypothetical protein